MRVTGRNTDDIVDLGSGIGMNPRLWVEINAATADKVYITLNTAMTFGYKGTVITTH